ncbi:MAG: hypothetical protein ACE366_20125 [Bradymonadia bacterium]
MGVEAGALTSWTRTLNEEDALMLLEQSEPGESLEAWHERGHEILPQSSHARRRETLRMVQGALLDVQGEGDSAVVADSAYLRMMRTGRPRLRLDLLYGRYLFEKSWILRALEELIHPGLEAAEAPLAEPDAGHITEEHWALWIDQHIKAGTGPTSVKKTRSYLIKNLSLLGVLRAEEGHTRVKRGEPARLAFGWVVAHEMATRHLGEMSEYAAAEKSRAAHLFATTPAYAEQCIEDAVMQGLLRREHLVGQARVTVGQL